MRVIPVAKGPWSYNMKKAVAYAQRKKSGGNKKSECVFDCLIKYAKDKAYVIPIEASYAVPMYLPSPIPQRTTCFVCERTKLGDDDLPWNLNRTRFHLTGGELIASEDGKDVSYFRRKFLFELPEDVQGAQDFTTYNEAYAASFRQFRKNWLKKNSDEIIRSMQSGGFSTPDVWNFWFSRIFPSSRHAFRKYPLRYVEETCQADTSVFGSDVVKIKLSYLLDKQDEHGQPIEKTFEASFKPSTISLSNSENYDYPSIALLHLNTTLHSIDWRYEDDFILQAVCAKCKLPGYPALLNGEFELFNSRVTDLSRFDNYWRELAIYRDDSSHVLFSRDYVEWWRYQRKDWEFTLIPYQYPGTLAACPMSGPYRRYDYSGQRSKGLPHGLLERGRFEKLHHMSHYGWFAYAKDIWIYWLKDRKLRGFDIVGPQSPNFVTWYVDQHAPSLLPPSFLKPMRNTLSATHPQIVFDYLRDTPIIYDENVLAKDEFIEDDRTLDETVNRLHEIRFSVVSEPPEGARLRVIFFGPSQDGIFGEDWLPLTRYEKPTLTEVYGTCHWQYNENTWQFVKWVPVDNGDERRLIQGAELPFVIGSSDYRFGHYTITSMFGRGYPYSADEGYEELRLNSCFHRHYYNAIVLYDDLHWPDLVAEARKQKSEFSRLLRKKSSERDSLFGDGTFDPWLMARIIAVATGESFEED